MMQWFSKIVLLGMLLMLSVSSQAQELTIRSPIPTECGDIIEGEFTINFEVHQYVLQMSAGDQIDASVVPIGDLLKTRIAFISPNGEFFGHSAGTSGYQPTESFPKTSSGILSANGTHTLEVTNWEWYNLEYLWETTGVGVYTLYVGCTLRNGDVIEPGANLQSAAEESTSSGIVSTAPAFSGFGFPGLAPVDFSNGVTIPLQTSAPNAGSISPGFEGIFGYSFSAETDQRMSFEFTRTGGNLNLGIVLLSADNQVIFQASLVTSERISTDLVIPAAGEYTLGVFRVDLVPPSSPENTTFLLTANTE